ncbi:serine protease snake-like isoform X1 [Phlebotomus argentipes]|uniref:serine protease snake-like isoform X1 n=1 Tax=Phlebotomus argentipes TaxID=94469 RepID=UPI0028935431|nr:serine protease snake-like isoform X1 [Phlebotomus argentipes]
MFQRLLFLLLCPLTFQQQDNIFFRDEVQDIGSPCRAQSGLGTCVLNRNCRDPFGGYFSTNKKSAICFFKDRTTPIVCCPNNQVVQDDEQGLPSSTSWEDLFPQIPSLKPTKRPPSRPDRVPVSMLNPKPMSDKVPRPQTMRISNARVPARPSFIPVSNIKPFPPISLQSPSNNPFPVVSEVSDVVPAPASSQQLTRMSSIKCQEYTHNYTSDNSRTPEASFFTAVVGGIPAYAGEFPHMAAIGMEEGSAIKYFCGGSLISDRYILTAAHCFTRNLPKEILSVRLGELDLTKDDDGASPRDYKVEQVITHPEYKGSSVYNDLTLLRLSEKVEFNPFIRPACLAKDPGSADEGVTAYGWGHTSFGGVESPFLQKISLSIYETSTCEKTYLPSRRLAKGLDRTQICAGDPAGFRDTCQGDSGGPLSTMEYVEDIDTNMFHILGITSFGQGCGGEIPAIYTRVFSYLDWIEGIVWKS